MPMHLVHIGLWTFFFECKVAPAGLHLVPRLKDRMELFTSPYVFMVWGSVNHRDSIFRCRQCNCNEKEINLSESFIYVGLLG